MIKLSPYHKIFYNEWCLDQTGSSYNIVFDNEMNGIVEFECLKNSLLRLYQDYYLLHSHVEEKEGEYYWCENSKEVYESIINYFSSPLTKLELLTYVKQPFDLHHGPLFRACIIKLDKKCYRFVLVFHHIIIDGNKFDFVFQEISKYYNNSSYQCELSIYEQCLRLSSALRDFESVLEQKLLNFSELWQLELKKLHAVGLHFLKPITKDTELSSERCATESIDELMFSFDLELLRKLKQASRQVKITPYFFSQSIFALVLYLFTRESDFGIFCPTAITQGKDFIYGASISPVVIPYHIDKKPL